jgi:hypothetical protein
METVLLNQGRANGDINSSGYSELAVLVVELAAETEMVMAGTDQGSGSGRWKRK